jgi:hypothetical protein
MQLKLQKVSLLMYAIAALLLTANLAAAQENTTLKDTTPRKRLRSPATARGFIGGESHDSYVIHARKGQIMTVRISWRRSDDNRTEFTVSKSPSFFDDGQVVFGKKTDNGRNWRGEIPETGNYYIYVVAHPTAHYILKVKRK